MDLVQLDVHEGVATLSLNRPDARNALSPQMCEEIVGVLETITVDRARVVLVRGEGPAFCAGADFAAVSGDTGPGFLVLFERMLEALVRHPLPSIAAIHGAAFGGGFQLATVCDLRVAAADARIGIPSARLGILVNLENIQRLVLMAGIATAKDMLMTSRTFTGTEALTAGLIDRCVPPAELGSAAEALACTVAERSPLSVQGTKRAVQTIVDHLAGARRGDAIETQALDELVEAAYNSADLREGLAARAAKRRPRFQGR